MSDQDFFAPPKRGRRYAITAVAAVLAVLLIVGAFWLGRDTGGPDDAAPDDDASSVDPETSSPGMDSGDALTVIAGERTEAGVSVGYPHTTVGAVSAAVEYVSQLTSTLDPDRAVEIADVVVHPDSELKAEDAAQGPVNTRKDLGLPEEGELPDGVSTVMAPVSYQLRDHADDEMTVLLLAYWTYTPETGEPRTEVAVLPAVMRWNGDDWKWFTQRDVADYSDLSADPASDDAKSKGWLGLTR
ncbi:MAG: hypothetical protein ACRDXX_01040 [Stackebrandtia sp.]